MLSMYAWNDIGSSFQFWLRWAERLVAAKVCPLCSRCVCFQFIDRRFIMLHLLDVVEERFNEREELAESRLFAKTLLMALPLNPIR